MLVLSVGLLLRNLPSLLVWAGLNSPVYSGLVSLHAAAE